MTQYQEKTLDRKASGQGQNQARLDLLPIELRYMIYKFLFNSTELHFGATTSRTRSDTIKEPLRALAILQVCRLIYFEAREEWLGSILFDFEDVSTMIERLTTIPPSILEQVRYVQTRGDSPMIWSERVNQETFCPFAYILKLIPKLRLERLTVHGCNHAEIMYEAIDSLVKHGNGWRELHFITPDSLALAFPSHERSKEVPFWRKPQPGFWNEELLRRDGPDSGASVKIYRSTVPYVLGSSLCPQTREVFEQMVACEADLAQYGLKEDEALTHQGEMEKELLVVVKRGRGANIMDPCESWVTDDQESWSRNILRTWHEFVQLFIKFFFIPATTISFPQ